MSFLAYAGNLATLPHMSATISPRHPPGSPEQADSGQNEQSREGPHQKRRPNHTDPPSRMQKGKQEIREGLTA